MARERIQRRSTMFYFDDDAVMDSTVRALTGASIGKQYEIYTREKIKARNLEPETAQSYLNAFKKYLTTMGIDEGDVVTELRVKDYIIELLDSDLIPRSVNSYIRNIRPFFYWLMRAGVVEPEEMKEPKVDERPFTAYKDEELAILMKPPKADARFTEVRNWAIVNFLVGTGCRIGSIPYVRICDVDFKNKEVIFPKVKSRRQYQTPMTDVLIKPLKWYINDCLSDKPDDFWLFPSQYGTQLTSDALKHAMIDYNRSRGVGRTSQHDYRRAFGLNFLREGGTIQQLQKLLNHKDISTTMKYFNIDMSDLKKNYNEHNLLARIANSSANKARGETIKRKK